MLAPEYKDTENTSACQSRCSTLSLSCTSVVVPCNQSTPSCKPSPFRASVALKQGITHLTDTKEVYMLYWKGLEDSHTDHFSSQVSLEPFSGFIFIVQLSFLGFIQSVVFLCQQFAYKLSNSSFTDLCKTNEFWIFWRWFEYFQKHICKNMHLKRLYHAFLTSFRVNYVHIHVNISPLAHKRTHLFIKCELFLQLIFQTNFMTSS